MSLVEPKSRRGARVLISSSAVALVLGIVLASMSTAGVIDMTAAFFLLVLAWVIGTTGVYVAEPLWGVSASKRVAITLLGSVFLAGSLSLVWLYEEAHQPKPVVAVTQPRPGVSAAEISGIIERALKAPPASPERKRRGVKQNSVANPGVREASPLPAVPVTDAVTPPAIPQADPPKREVLKLTETESSMAGMKFAAGNPVLLEGAVQARLRIKITLGVGAVPPGGSKERTDIEFYKQISSWRLTSPVATCKGDPKSVDAAIYAFLAGDTATQYVEFICNRPPSKGVPMDLYLLIKQKNSATNGLYGYQFATPPVF